MKTNEVDNLPTHRDSMKGIFLCLRLVFNVNSSTIKRTTGYGYAVRDLAKALVEKGYSLDCISVNDEPNLKEWNGIKLVSRNWSECLKYLRIGYIIKGIRLARKLSAGVVETLRIVYYFAFGGWIEHTISQKEYEFISIQGFNRYAYPYVIACEKMNLRYSVSFHALDCFEDIYQDMDEKFFEEMLIHFAKERTPVSFLSQKMKNKAISVIPSQLVKQAEDSFKVIYNGIAPIMNTYSTPSIINDIPFGTKVLLCVGNVNERKNQIQVIRALSEMDYDLIRNLHVIIIGQIQDQAILSELEKSAFKDRVHLLGAIPRNDLYPYYERADFIVLPSLSEGFGLSIIESFSFGKPVLMWDDLDVAKEINDDTAVLLIHGHTDNALAAGISEMMNREWKSVAIKNLANQYTINAMADNYVAWFSNSGGSI